MIVPEIRPARAEDIPALCAIEAECFSLPWSRQAFIDFFANGCSRCLVASVEGILCGYVGMNLLYGEGEITNIAITERFRKLGIGSALMAELTRTEGLSRLMLDVRSSNTAARRFYEKHGFTVDGIRRSFYSNPREDGVLMSREITKTDEQGM